jgi:hypothetical protein
MTLYSQRILFPEGDWQEAPVPLTLDSVVDINGYPQSRPLPGQRMLVYRVYRISTLQEIGEEIRCYHLIQLDRNELDEYSL